MRRSLFSVVLCLLLMAGFVTTAFAADKKDSSALVAGIIKAADRQLALQGTYINGNTGVGVYTCAWEWQIGTGLAYANTQSSSARGLVAAYEVTKDRKYLIGAVCAADQIVAALDANVTLRPFSEDVIFLMELSEFGHNRMYAKKAKVYHQRIRAKYLTGTALADYYITKRLSLAGWDLASHIQAALAVDQEEYAKAIAIRLIERRVDWEGVLYGGWDYSLISQVTLVGALQEFKGKKIKQYRDELRALSLAAQAADGSWGDDFQVTAFALIGLSASPRSVGVKRAIDAGLSNLLTIQSPEGGWVYEGWGESPEVNGEVLTALALYVRHHGEDDDERDDHDDR